MSTFIPKDVEVWELKAPEIADATATQRKAAFERFQALDWPTTKVERWHYTSLKALRDHTPNLAVSAEVSQATLEAAHNPEALAEIVLINGRWDPVLSRIPKLQGLHIGQTSIEALAQGFEPNLSGQAAFDDDAVTALNTALWTDGVWIDVEAGHRLKGIVQITHIGAGCTQDAHRSHIHHRITVGREASLHLVERWVTDAPDDRHWTFGVFETDIADAGSLTHDVWFDLAPASGAIFQRYIKEGRNAKFESTNFISGGRLIRQESEVLLAGEGAHTDVRGVTVATQRAHHDFRVVVTHAGAHSTSRVLGRTIAGDKARAVLDAYAVVQKGAVGCDLDQDVRGLLLSKTAEIDVKPQMEIYVDEVAARHGATIGQLDEIARFYLRSRGIPDTLAKRMLISAFLSRGFDGLDLSLRDKALEDLDGAMTAAVDEEDV